MGFNSGFKGLKNPIVHDRISKSSPFIVLHRNVLTHSYIENSNKMQQCIKLLLFLILNEAQHISGDTQPIIKSLKLHKQSLVLHTWKVVGRAVVGRFQVQYAT